MARISRNASVLSGQLAQAIAQVTIEEGAGTWPPPPAPTSAELTTLKANIDASITDTDAKEDAWKVAAQLKGTRVGAGVQGMQKTVQAASLLYGPGGAELNLFGVVPEGQPLAPLHKLLEIVVTDGPVAGSLKFDWEHIEGASYEVQWSGTSDFSAIVGSAVSASASDYIISGLTPGTQYWMRVRPIRGGQTEAWSDPATRVAPV